MTMLQVGQEAPEFVGTTDENSEFTLSDLRGHVVVLYFYPRAHTPGCIKEACSFRDNMMRLVGLGVKVVGVSVDSVKRQASFKAKYNLDFPLIADEDKTVTSSYGVLKPNGKSALRVTFLIDREGIIRHIWEKVKVTGHVDQIIEVLKELKL
ncbi:MAG: peroxiredoxin [Promethearchaeota archaeon]